MCVMLVIRDGCFTDQYEFALENILRNWRTTEEGRWASRKKCIFI